MPQDVGHLCRPEWFNPYVEPGARWIELDSEFELLQRFHDSREPDDGYSWSDAVRWRENGFRDAGIVEEGVLLSRAALWACSDDAWELAGVFTLPEARGRGLGRSVCSFVTAAILQAGHVASCHTAPGNQAMRRVLESLGYRAVGL